MLDVDARHGDRGGERSEVSQTPTEQSRGRVSCVAAVPDAPADVLSGGTLSVGTSLIFLGPGLLMYGLYSFGLGAGVGPVRKSAAQCSFAGIGGFERWSSGARVASEVSSSWYECILSTKDFLETRTTEMIQCFCAYLMCINEKPRKLDGGCISVSAFHAGV